MKKRLATKLLMGLIVFGSGLTFILKSSAQIVRDTDYKSDQSLKSNATVNPSTLAMEFSIPVGVYRGRGGNALPVSFDYSSKVWQIQAGLPFDIQSGTVITPARPVYGKKTTAGWKSSLSVPRIDFLSNIYDGFNPNGYNGQVHSNFIPSGGGSSESYDLFWVKRLHVEMPDGSTHEMRADDSIIGCGSSNSGCLQDIDGIYYSTDGTKMRLETSESASTLFLPDGSRYQFGARGALIEATTFFDRHGNRMSFDAANRRWTDTLGRLISDPFPSNWNSQQQAAGDVTATFPSFSNGTTGVVFSWRYLKDPNGGESGLTQPNQELAFTSNIYCQGNAVHQYSTTYPSAPHLFTNTGEPRLCGPGYNQPGERFNPVVLTKITLASGQSYQFKYNLYGEIEKIIYPTGAYERFRYEAIQPVQPSDFGYDQANRGVAERWVSVKGDGTDETQMHWMYQVTPPTYQTPLYKITTTAPDSSRKVRYLYFEENHEPQPFGFGKATTGRSYEDRTYAAGGSEQLLERHLIDYAQTTNSANAFGAPATRDLRPKREISIVFEPDATSALAMMSETVYEVPGQNGVPTDQAYFAPLNPKQAKSYHYIALDLTTAQNANIDQIAALFGNTNLATVTETDYFYDANYKARNINGLRSETRALNPTNTTEVLSKSQIVYDEDTSYPLINAGTTTNWQDPNTVYRGNPTTLRTWVKETNLWIETHSQFDNFGNLRKQWDSSNDASRFIETQYASQYGYAYPTKIIAPAPDPTGTHGMTETSEITKTYDFNTGLVLTVTDANGQTTTNEYDAYLRPKKMIPAAGGSITEAEYGAPDASGQYPADQRFVKMKTQIDESNWAESTTWFDGLGRTIKSRSKDAQGDVFAEIQYDGFGRVKQVSSPYRQGEAKLWSKPRYDNAGRVVEGYAPSPDGQTGASLGSVEFGISTVAGYVGTYVTGTDASGRKMRSISTAYGIARVDEPTGSNNDLGSLSSPNQPTSYQYNARGELVKMTQGNPAQAGQTIQYRHFLYDSLGRLIRVRQPEQDVNPNLATSGNPDNNGWTAGFTYNVFGNVVKMTDAKGINIINEYDKSGRATARCYTKPNVQTSAVLCSQISGSDASADTPRVDYYYDGKGLAATPQFARGNLTKVSSSVSEDRYTSFDNFGRLLASQQITDEQTYTFGYKYNLSGGLVEETYPSLRVVKNHLGSDGGLTAVSSKTATGQFKNYVSNFDYSAAGAVKSMMLGNGRWETAQFNDRLQLTQIGLGNSATDTSLWRADYEYGELNADGMTVNANKNTGSVAKQTITLPTTNFVQTYKYDEINRLVEARETTNGVQNWKQMFGYDKFGNRTSFFQDIGGITTTNTPTVDVAKNRFTTGQGYIYDFNGNLIQDADGRTFKFNGDDKQIEVRNTNDAPNASPVGRYYYDGDGRRVKKETNTETTIFVYDAGGDLVAEYSTAAPPATPTTSYLTTDNLGSPRVITDRNGVVISRRDFMPFGEELGVGVGGRTENLKYSVIGTDNIRKRFTGYEKDDETGLDFAEARMYQNKHGRFTAVDPLISSASLSNPQTFNRYAYTGNNPVNYTDPSGLSWCRQNGGTTTEFTGVGVGCGIGSTSIDGTAGTIRNGSLPTDTNGSAGPGSVVVFNPNGTVRVLDASNQQDQAQIAQATGAQIEATAEAILDSGGATLGDHVTSAFMTLGENNGGSLAYSLGVTPYNQHTEAGQFAGNFLSTLQGAAEIALGTLTATGGGLLTIFTAPACVTGVGCAIPATTGSITAGGLIAITHGAAVIGNTVLNMSANQGDSSRSGGSEGNTAKDYNSEGRGRFRSGEDNLDQLEGVSEAQKNVRDGKLNKSIDSIKKSEQRVDHTNKKLRNLQDAIDEYGDDF